MSAWSEIRERLRALVARRREERELEEELSFHLEMETEANVRRGLSPAEAKRRAHLALGGGDVVREQVREARGTRLIEDLRRDLSLAVRMLGKQKQFTFVMLAVLALGIGANTATWTVLDALLLRPLPVPHPERLVSIGNPARTGGVSQGTPSMQVASYPLYQDVKAGTTSFSGLYATGRTDRLDVLVDAANADASAEPEHPKGRFVSGEFFQVLQVSAQLGRVFGPQDDQASGGPAIAVVSHDYWQTHLGGSPGAIGQSIRVNGVPVTVIGVAQEGFSGDVVGSRYDLWFPMTTQPTLEPHNRYLDNRGVSWLLMMARLKPGVTLEQARTEVKALEQRTLLDQAGADDRQLLTRNFEKNAFPLQSGERGFSSSRASLQKPLLTLMAAVTLMLLVACANVASLMLVRATSRTREMGVRMALGAGRGRVVRQLLAESAVLAAVGGALGLGLSRWGTTLLLRLASGGTAPLPLNVAISPRVLGFTALLSIGTALLFGVLPALRATRAVASLGTQGRGIDSGPDRLPAGRVLVVAQVALSMVLLVGTGMLVRSMSRLRDANVGFDHEHTIVGWIDAGRAGYDTASMAPVRAQVLERVSRLPGVVDVSYSENGLFSGTNSATTLHVDGFAASAMEDTISDYDDVGPGYFRAIGARVVQGRDFEPTDDANGEPVAVLNEAGARFYFHGDAPLGRYLTIGKRSFRVVGVVADAQQVDVRAERERRIYLPTVQITDKPSWFYLIVRAQGDPAPLLDPIRQAIRSVDPKLPLLSLDRVQANIDESLAQDLMVTRVVTFFGAIAMLLAAVGLFGLMAYGAARRTGEFGLRMALGARGDMLTRMMLGEAAALVGVGLALGVPVALVAMRLLKSQIFGIGLFDPTSVAFAMGVLLVTALLAGAVPAIRAGRVSPVTSLRTE